MIKVIKKDKTIEVFDQEKIKAAVSKAAFRCDKKLSDGELQEIANCVLNHINCNEVSVSTLHEIVIASLHATGNEDIAEKYSSYRYYKLNFAHDYESIKQDADDVLRLGDRENANFDSSLVSTKGSLIKGYLTKTLYKRFYLSDKESELIKRGDIYIHDLRDMILGCVNCFSGETKFISSTGVHSFNEYNDGDTVIVPSHLGNWKKAVVRCYGKQKLQKVEFRRAASKSKVIYCTSNHRWILKDGSQTTQLKVGDKLCKTPIISRFNWDSLSLADKKLWCLGFMIGDGYCPENGHASARLCGHKVEFANRFIEAGYTVSYPSWANGDAKVVCKDIYAKRVPFEILTHENIKVLMSGYMAADGNRYKPAHTSYYRGCFAVGKINDHLYHLLSAAGYFVTRVDDSTCTKTNFGIRNKLSLSYQTYEDCGDRTWFVHSITNTDRYERVWCLEVEDDHSFLLDSGIPTGNCCLFDVAKVMKGGFTMSNVDYTEPKTVLAALQLIGDITLVATAQQFGGFTLAEIDKVLLPYVYKSYNKHFARYSNDCELPASKADKLAKQDTIRELEQGFQSLELKLNTVPCSRGDFAFTTLTFAQWNVNLSNEDKFWLKTICSTILKTRRQGHGANGKPVVFPKLVYLYDHLQVKYDTYSAELFDEAVKTSAECMYPDYLAINSEYGTVSRLFKEQGVITSPMGCRAYLSPWKNDEGRYITIGRCNIGAVSLNLPLILKQTQLRTENWQEEFWVDLKNCMDVIRNFLKKRYDIIRKQKCSSNPLAYTQGGFYEGTKHMDDEVGDLVRYMTASFGITALDEFTYLWTNERLCERQDIAKRALDFIQKTVNQYKEEDGYLYALYGTPAESLCATQAKQFDQFCKDNNIENPFANHEHYSIEYFTNSFHCNVTEDITPIEKQNKEFECFHNCEGGHIQYVRLDNPSNLQAVKKIIERGMEMGFYQGVNFDSAYCNDCGKHSTNVLFKCPHCGSSNISVISRVCGYLGYSNVNGHSRMNDGKMEEIVNRVSM